MDEMKLQRLSSEEVKSKLLSMTKDVTSLLEKRGIKYTLFYGSLLGAIRHQGFIPWDDDIDLVIEAKDVKNLRESFNLAHLDYYDSTQNGYFDWVNRVSDPSTLVSINDDCAQSNKLDFENNQLGLCVDIYPLYRLPQTKLLQPITLLCHKLSTKVRKFAMKRNSRGAIKFANVIDGLLGKVKGDLVFTKADYNIFYSYTDFKNSVRKQFCDFDFRVPKNSEKVLLARYGDWEQLPTKEEIETWVHYEETFQIINKNESLNG